MKKKAIQQTKWFKDLQKVGPFNPYEIAPYSTKGRSSGKVSRALRQFRGVPGVYIIKDKSGAPMYVGATGYSLYTSVLRRFQEWNDPRFDRKTYDARKGHTAEVIPMPRQKANIWRVEDHFIGKLKPKDNIEGLFAGKPENETEEDYYLRIEREEREALDGFVLSKKFTDRGDLGDLFDDLRDVVVPF